MAQQRPNATLDQQRAEYAWACAVQRAALAGYREIAKGAPALLMGSGLMAALAYWQSRTGSNKVPAQALAADVIGWLAKRRYVPNDFGQAMKHFSQIQSLGYMRATDETLAMLKWLRQFADAVDEARSDAH